MNLPELNKNSNYKNDDIINLIVSMEKFNGIDIKTNDLDKGEVDNEKSDLTESEKHGTKNIIKEALIESLENTTIHAIPNIMRSDNMIQKIFWFILFLGGAYACMYCNSQPYFNFSIKNNFRNFLKIVFPR